MTQADSVTHVCIKNSFSCFQVVEKNVHACQVHVESEYFYDWSTCTQYPGVSQVVQYVSFSKLRGGVFLKRNNHGVCV